MGVLEETIGKGLYLTGWALFFLAFTCYFLGKVLRAEYLIPGAGFAQKMNYLIIFGAIIYVVRTYLITNGLLQVFSPELFLSVVLLWLSIVVTMLICRLPIISHLTPQTFGQASSYVVIAYVFVYLAKQLDSSNDVNATMEYLKSVLVYKW